jgi:two-component system, cell cycle response regulator
VVRVGEMSSDLFERLRDADQLPTAPGVALRIVELNQRDDIDIDELAELIGCDPALAAKVIKTANSSMFGVPREVTNIKRAVLVLGLRTVNLLALSFSVIASATGSAAAGFSYRRFWTQTAVTAVASRLLALRAATGLKDEAFLAGLLSGFGQLVLAERAVDAYGPVLERVTQTERHPLDVERELLGSTHVELGARLLDAWGLPQPVCEAIRIHRDAALLCQPNGSMLGRIVGLAALCAETLSGRDVEARTEQLHDLGAKLFGLDRAICSELLTQVQESVGPLGSALGLDLEGDAVLGPIRRHATELLLRETLALHQQVKAVSNEMTSLERRARTDALTGLRNRGTFDQEIKERLDRVRTGAGSLGLLMIDVDYFKSVNDQHGHPAGDALLREAAAGIQSVLSSQDAAYRYGGEEFVVLVAASDVAELRARAEQVRSSIAMRSVSTPKGPVSRTASVGGCFVVAGHPRLDVTAVIEHADRLLYQSKSSGRDRSTVQPLV